MLFRAFGCVEPCAILKFIYLVHSRLPLYPCSISISISVMLIGECPSETTAKPETYFMVSRERVEHSIGRQDELDEILSYFSDNEATQPRRLILHALGGQGKSQIALEYCHRSKAKYRGIFWINASSTASAVQSYGPIAAAVTGISSVSNNAEAVIRVVKDQLAYWSERWLLVLDNYDQPEKFEGVRGFIPSSKNFSAHHLGRH